jgi:two-component system, NarL family, response regulator LiaR
MPPNGDSCRVVLVDDHDLIRKVLRTSLESHGVEIVGEAAEGEAAIRVVLETGPDVVLMDLDMPGLSGVEATRRLATLAPLSRVLVLTGSAAQKDVVDAIMAGATGYLIKDAPIEELIRAIEAVRAGESVVSSKIAGRILERVRDRDLASPGTDNPAEAIRAVLTDRELQVLKLLAAGKENREIAEQLHISPNTVKNQVASILAKLQLENRIQAAVHAVRSGIV